MHIHISGGDHGPRDLQPMGVTPGPRALDRLHNLLYLVERLLNIGQQVANIMVSRRAAKP